MRRRIAVIGGGWAGLAAAVELGSAGEKVVLFEAGKRPGGRARRVDIDGRALDNGQHLLLGAYRETLRLMGHVGADTSALLHRLPLAIDHPAAGFRLALPRLPAPLHLAAGLIAARGLSLREKWAALRFMRRLAARHYRLPADLPLARWLTANGQHGALRRHLWEPLCLAALNTRPDEASAQIFANVLRDSLGGAREATDLLVPAADLSRLFPDPAIDALRGYGAELRFSQRVKAIEPGLRLEGEAFEAIVLASAPQHAAALIARLPGCASLIDTLAAYAYEPIATLYAAYPPSVALPRPMLGLNGGSGGTLGQWAFDRRFAGAPGLIAFVLSARGPWQALDEATLAAKLHGELEAALRSPLPHALWRRLVCERRATFACRPALPRPAARTPVPGLWLAGDYVCADYPATLEGAVRSGVAAAHGILGVK